MNSAIAIIGYQRLDHLSETLHALSANYGAQECPLYIFIDGPKDTNKKSVAFQNNKNIQSYVNKFTWKSKKHIIASTYNRGLQMGVRFAIDTVLSDYDSAIIVEDDIVTSPYFYRFMKTALSKYKQNNSVGAICGHCYPYSRNYFNPKHSYFLQHFACWGWGTWRRVWEHIEWDTESLVKKIQNIRIKKQLDLGLGNAVSGHLIAHNNGYINTWDVQVGVSLFLHKQLCLFPPQSLTSNIGWRGDGSTHMSLPYDQNSPLAFYEATIPEKLPVQESQEARKAYAHYFYPNKLKVITKFLAQSTETLARKVLKHPVKKGPYKQV